VERIGNNSIVNQIHAMKQRMDVLYSKSFREQQEDPAADHPEAPDQRGLFNPPVDIWETGKEWLIIVDLPGVGAEDFHVEFVDDKLVIRGHRKTAPVLEDGSATQLERPDGAFSRSFVLPGDTQAEAIKAELKQGVLAVVIPKSSGLSTASQKVPVKAG
jgi:HSP20 family protein